MIFGVEERGSRWWRRIVKRRVGMAVMETASSDTNTENSTEEGEKEGRRGEDKEVGECLNLVEFPVDCLFYSTSEMTSCVSFDWRGYARHRYTTQHTLNRAFVTDGCQMDGTRYHVF